MNQNYCYLRTACGAILASLLLLAGCASNEKTVRSPAVIPPSFSYTDGPPLSQQWWTSFDDPGLNTAISRALSGNFDLQTAWDRMNQARAIARREGADLWPSVDGSGSAARSVDHADGSSTYQNDFALGLAVNYELDLWGRIRSTRDAAVLDAQASEQDMQAAAISLTASVAKLWYQFAEQQAQVRLIEQQVQANEQVLEVLTLQFRQGQIQAVDLLRQRQLVEQTQGQLTQAQSSVVVTRHQLAVLLGQPPESLLGLPDPALVVPPPVPEAGIPSELLQRRPDLISARQAVLAADQRLGAAIADQYPRISLSASAQTTATRASDLFDNWAANLAGNLTQPLLDGGLRKAEVERNQAVVSEAINAYGSAVLTALQEVEDALSQEAHQTRFLTSLNQQLMTSQQVHERTQDSYLNGQLDYIRVLEALVSRQSLQRELLTAERELLEHRIELCQALAGSWDLPVPEPRTLD